MESYYQLVGIPRFVKFGVAFCHMDTWTNRTNAHRMFQEYCVGKLDFFMKTRISSNDANNNSKDRDARRVC